MTDTAKSLTISNGNLSLTNPNDVMQFGNLLKDYINKNKLSTKISGKDYAHVDGWKFAGLNFGIVAIPDEPILISQPGETFHVFYKEVEKQSANGKYKVDVAYMATQMPESIEKEILTAKKFHIFPVYKYKCNAAVVNIATGQKIGFGTAICTNMELIKTGFDEYAVASMCQTRAIGKALRNLLGFVMNSAGIEATPAEEMDESYTKDNRPSAIKWSEDIQREIDLLTDEKGLVEYWNQLKELHSDVRFVNALTKQREKLGIPQKKGAVK